MGLRGGTRKPTATPRAPDCSRRDTLVPAPVPRRQNDRPLAYSSYVSAEQFQRVPAEKRRLDFASQTQRNELPHLAVPRVRQIWKVRAIENSIRSALQQPHRNRAREVLRH